MAQTVILIFEETWIEQSPHPLRLWPRPGSASWTEKHLGRRRQGLGFKVQALGLRDKVEGIESRA